MKKAVRKKAPIYSEPESQTSAPTPTSSTTTTTSTSVSASLQLRRRTTQKFRARQREIVKGVRELLVEDGYAALSMRRVAERCNMQLGNLQHYFKTRDELVIAFVKEWIRFESLERQVLEANEGHPVETLLRWVDDAFTHLAAKENGIAAIQLWALACHDEVAHRQLALWYAEQKRYYGGLIRRARPDLSVKLAEERAMALFGLCEGMAMQVVMRTSPKARLDATRATINSAASSIIFQK